MNALSLTIKAIAIGSLTAFFPWHTHLALAAILPLYLYLWVTQQQTQAQVPLNPPSIPPRKKQRIAGEERDNIVVRRHPAVDNEDANRSWVDLVVNVLLTAGVVYHLWGSTLLIPHKDAQFARRVLIPSGIDARMSSLTPTSAVVTFRLPSTQTAQVAYRPLLQADLLSETSPISWSYSHPATLSAARDWVANVQLDDLTPGIQYEYRVGSLDIKNFTTFPDHRVKQRFRFIHASPPIHPMRPFPVSSSPNAWTRLNAWVEDLHQRTAWSPVAFAMIGTEQWPSRRGEREQARQDMSQAVFNNIVVLPTRVHSPSSSAVEPGALVEPASSFTYGSTWFYRLRMPYTEPNEDDSQDWQLEVDHLATQLATVNTTSAIKIIFSPITLAPFFGGSDIEIAWRTAVLEVLRYVTNVVVLAESPASFSASLLRKTVVEIASPSLDGRRNWFDRPVLPNQEAAQEDTTTRWTVKSGQAVEEVTFETVDQMLRYIPTGSGAQWSSIEIDELESRVYAVFVEDGHPLWRLEVVCQETVTKAVGSVAETLHHWLKRFGLLSIKW